MQVPWDDFTKVNDCHNPSGPSGGQFCSTANGLASSFVAEGEAMGAKLTETVPLFKEMDSLQKAIDKKHQESTKLFQALHETSDPQSKEILSTRIHRLSEEAGNLNHRKVDLLNQNPNIFREIEGQVKPTQTQIQPYNNIAAEFHAHNSARMGPVWLSNMVGDAGVPAQHHPTFQLTDDTRAYATANGRGGSSIFLHHTNDTGTAVHELGHWLEFARSDVYQAATGFLNQRYRTAQDTTKHIRSLSEENGSYGKDEVGFRDKFMSPYTGKIYANGQHIHATEIVSMGLEQMYRDPVRFRMQDPEHFHFTLGLMKHVAHTPSPGSTASGPPVTGAWSLGDLRAAQGGR